MKENNKLFFDILIDNNINMDMTPLDQQLNYVKPDDDFDFHAYRILLLLYICGSTETLVSEYPVLFGRRKFAFFDFLIRYPFYLEKVLHIKKKTQWIDNLELKEYEKIEAFSQMIYYLRGPWDNSYDDIFNYMLSKELIELEFDKITKSGKKQFCLCLTETGLNTAIAIKKDEPLWTKRMSIINNVFPKKTTNEMIDKLIFKNFPELIIGGVNDVY